MREESQIIVRHAFDMQVCVPKDWTNKQIKAFADKENPCGTTKGWFIRRQGSPLLDGKDERVECSEQPDYIHVILDA